MPNAVTYGACVWTAAVASGRARYDPQCIWYSTEGGFVPLTTLPSSRMQTRSSAASAPLYIRLGVIQMHSASAARALTFPPVGVSCPMVNSSPTTWMMSSRASASVCMGLALRSAAAVQHAAGLPIGGHAALADGGPLVENLTQPPRAPA